MGGRIASMVVAAGDVPVAGLALLAYPLVPPGQSFLRPRGPLSEHRVPTLFCSGTRDNFATPEQLRDAVRLVPGATLYFLEGADHGFATLKASGRSKDDVYCEAVDALLAFFGKLHSGRNACPRAGLLLESLGVLIRFGTPPSLCALLSR